MSKLLENYLTLKNSFRDKSFSNTLLLISETFNVTPNQMMASESRLISMDMTGKPLFI